MPRVAALSAAYFKAIMSHWEPIRWNAKTLFKFVFAVIGIYSSFILWGVSFRRVKVCPSLCSERHVLAALCLTAF